MAMAGPERLSFCACWRGVRDVARHLGRRQVVVVVGDDKEPLRWKCERPQVVRVSARAREDRTLIGAGAANDDVHGRDQMLRA